MDRAATVDVANGSLDPGDDIEFAVAICAVRLPDEELGLLSIAPEMIPDLEQLVSLPFAQKDGADLRRAGKLECVDDLSGFHGSPLVVGWLRMREPSRTGSGRRRRRR
jgi:hypothetical protein